MGCGESKHAVSTENTVVSKSNSKRLNSIKNENNPPVSNETKDSGSGNVKENETPEEVKEEKSENDKTKEIKNGEKGIEGNEEKQTEAAVVVVDEKKEEIKIEEKKYEITDKDGVVVVEKENIISHDDSCNNVFSDHETIEYIIPEGVSGKSEYHSPRASDVHEDEEEDNDAVVEGKGINESEAKPDEKEKEDGTKNGEGKEVVVAVDETATAEDEKIPAAQKENVNAASDDDVKEN